MSIIEKLKSCEEYTNGFNSFIGVPPNLMEEVIASLEQRKDHLDTSIDDQCALDHAKSFMKGFRGE